MAEIQTSTWSETADNNNSASPNGAPEGMAGMGFNNTIREIMAAIKREWNRSHATVIAGGTADVLTLTYGTAPPSYVAGMLFGFYTGGSDNTGAVTVNVNGLGAKALVRRNGSTALSAADLKANTLYFATYDGTAFRLHATGI